MKPTIKLHRDSEALFEDLAHPAEPYPRSMVAVTLPLSLPHVATLVVPDGMSGEEWDRMLAALTQMRPGLVRETAA